ncbi:hypothetical protein BDQ17DRAFT_1430285 [Cyathus striatus]|nr:hypothetical protein BDQ17DRAFT_1430285 [Cyathus striatus]
MSTKNELYLSLDPGIQHRKPSSPCKCLIWSGIICIGLFAAICAILVLFFIYSLVMVAVRSLNSPYAWAYHNTTLEGVTNHSNVVRPLIDEGQTFDIVASVWVRNGPFRGLNEPVPEALLFSDVVFRGVSLKDRGILSKVSFQVPTSIFKESRIVTNFDLRGSFALVPSSFVLDHVVNVTSWIPDHIVSPPVRPLNPHGNHPFTDFAIDSYGLHVPLIEFHPIISRCVIASDYAQDMPPGNSVGSDDQFQAQRSTIENLDIKNITNSQNNTSHKIFASNMGLKALESHPHIVTRSHLRVTDFTHIMNFEKFNNTFHMLRTKSCGQQLPDIVPVPCWQLCPEVGTFSGIGLWRTALLRFETPEEYERNRTEWAYAPYLSSVQHASGPQDLDPLPVSREHCNQTHHSLLDEDLVNVTWSITYSGRTPAKMLVGDLLDLSSSVSPGTNSSETERMDQQLFAELTHGIYGHKHKENAHPRRYLGIALLKALLLDGFNIISELLYWYTRVSTVGISTSGTVLAIISDSFAYILSAMYAYSSLNGVGFRSYWIPMIWAIGPFSIIINLLKLKTIVRLQVERRRILFPVIKVLPPSHTERASMRVDAKLWKLRFSALLLSTLGYLFMKNKLIAAATWITKTPSYTSQIVFNYQRQTFLWMYKATAICMAITALGKHLLHSPIFVGDITGSTKLIFDDYIWTLVIAINLYQALRYSSKEYKDGEE